LRSVRENAPLIAEAIADQFGVTIGQLKQIGAEGKITSDIVFDAILNDAQKIEAQFAVTTPTISDSFTILRNKGAEFVSTMNESVGASEALSKFILVVANNLDLLADAAVVAAVAFGSAKLGLAMANFAKALRTSNALLILAE